MRKRRVFMDNATEIRLAESALKAPVRPADQSEAFTAANADGLLVKEAATRFGVSSTDFAGVAGHVAAQFLFTAVSGLILANGVAGVLVSGAKRIGTAAALSSE